MYKQNALALIQRRNTITGVLYRCGFALIRSSSFVR